MTMLLFGIIGFLGGLYYFSTKGKELNKYLVIGGATLVGLLVGKIMGAILSTILTYCLIGGTIVLGIYVLMLKFKKQS